MIIDQNIGITESVIGSNRELEAAKENVKRELGRPKGLKKSERKRLCPKRTRFKSAK